MKSVKKLIRMLGILYCFLIFVIPDFAQADVIWEPDDDFYKKHIKECIYEGRSYSANNEDGSITIYKSPGSKKKVGTYSVSEGYYVTFTYTDKQGVQWGVLEIEGKTGWIPMSRLTLIYDFRAFYEDYQHKFLKYKGEFDDVLENPFLLWTFPGSGVIEAEYEKPETIPVIQETYTDLEGRIWGSVHYYYGSNGWICLDDLTNEDIPAFGKHTLVEADSPDKKDIEDNVELNSRGEWILPVVLVGGLVIITAILIRVLYKKGDVH